jgi:hypothetical protein
MSEITGFDEKITPEKQLICLKNYMIELQDYCKNKTPKR